MAVSKASGRIRWMDCARAVAILAVVVDHGGTLYEDGMLRLPEGQNGMVHLLYESPWVTLLCWFSVSLFFLLSGVSAWVSSGGGTRVSYQRQARRMGRLLGGYALATLVIQVAQTGAFRWEEYVLHLLRFDVQGIFYYLFLLLQLMLLSPLLLRWCCFCNGRQRRAWWHGGTVLALCGAACLCIRFMRTLPLFGGGKFLLGGTYLVLYGLGMQLAGLGCFQGSGKQQGALLCGSGGALLLWLWLIAKGALPFDAWLVAALPEMVAQPAAPVRILGSGTFLSNPPGLLAAVYALLLLFFLYAGFSLLEQKGGRPGRGIVAAFAWLGRYTLPIYLYHLLVRNVLLAALPWEAMGMWARRAVFLPCMALLPAAVAAGWKKAKASITGFLPPPR